MTSRKLYAIISKLQRTVPLKKLLWPSSKKHFGYYLWVVVVIAIVLFVQNPTLGDTLTRSQPGLYPVISISDGDTITVDMNGEEQIIRFIGVDTPETHHPSRPVQCFGKQASSFTTELLSGQTVRLEADPESDNRDRYARLLRYVYLPDGTLVNAELVRQGYGFAPVAFVHSKLEEFQVLEENARQQRQGLWSGCEHEVNEYGSYQTAPEAGN